jgi:integrase
MPAREKKKMPKVLTSLNTLLGYYPAEIKKSKSGWRIVYYVENPAETDPSKKMVRKVVKCNRIKDTATRSKFARDVCKEINYKLAHGWNPFLEASAPKGFVKIKDAIRIFLQTKKKELAADSMRTYISFCNILKDWIDDQRKVEFAVSFTESMAIDFLNYCYLEKEISNATYNNYLAFYRLLFYWMIENKYSAINPFQKIKKKKAMPKKRRLLTKKERKKLKQYLDDQPEFLAVVLLAFHALLRPTEIINLKPINFNLDAGYIMATITKNKKSRVIALPGFLVDHLKRLNIGEIPANNYVFGKHYRPSKTKYCPREISRKWNNEIRPNCGFGMDIQFYSLRDSGIVQMLRDGVPLEEVQKHADHADITTTQKYITLAFPQGVKSVKELSSEF